MVCTKQKSDKYVNTMDVPIELDSIISIPTTVLFDEVSDMIDSLVHMVRTIIFGVVTKAILHTNKFPLYAHSVLNESFYRVEETIPLYFIIRLNHKLMRY